MKENAKCFIKIKKGIYEEITYKELKEKRNKYITYKKKRFIQLDDILLEVSKREYETIDAEEQRLKYINRTERNIKIISYDKEDDNGTVLKDVIPDSNYNLEFEIERKMEIEKLEEALFQLNDEEYNLIKALFFEQKTLREYAEMLGIPFMTIQNRKNKILEKLKKILKKLKIFGTNPLFFHRRSRGDFFLKNSQQKNGL